MKNFKLILTVVVITLAVASIVFVVVNPKSREWIVNRALSAKNWAVGTWQNIVARFHKAE